MPQTRITDYFRPVNAPGQSSPAPAPTRAPRPARNGPAAPELQARAPRPYSTPALNRDHARVDLGTKFAAFSERMRREQAPAPAAPQYVLSHMTQPAPAPTAGPSSSTPPTPLFVLSHMTQPAPAAAPPAPQYILSHMTQPAPAPAAEPSSSTAPTPLFVLSHTTQAQAHAPQPPLYYLNHNPHPVYSDPFAPENRHTYFAGRMYNLLAGLPNRFLPRRRRNGDA
jgi:hypothetical protein